MNPKHVVILFAFSVLLYYPIASATPGLHFNHLKKMGMGDAGVALSTDDSALYINPAGLSAIKSLQIKSPRAQIKIGSEFVDRYSEIADFFSGEDANMVQLVQLVGLDGTLGLQLSPLVSVTMPGFGISALTGYDMTMKINHDASLSAFGQSDSALAVGAADTWTFFGQPLSLGASLKGIYRRVLYDKITGESRIELESGEVINRINTNTIGDSFQNFGVMGFGIDLGALSNVNLDKTQITLGAAFRNIGASLNGEKSLVSGTQSTSVTLPFEAVVGAAATPTLPLIGDLTVAMDYTVSPSDSFYTSLHLGAEKKFFGDLIHIRGGVNQGYITGGAGTDLGFFKFDYIYYTRERGQTAGAEPDPTHAIELGFLL